MQQFLSKVDAVADVIGRRENPQGCRDSQWLERL